MKKNNLNIFSNFNIDNFRNILKEKINNYRLKLFSNSLILDKLNNQTLKDSINVFFLDTDLINENFIQYFYKTLKNDTSLKIILLFSFQKNNICLPILKDDYQSESKLLFDFQKKFKDKNFIFFDVNLAISSFNEKVYNPQRWFSTKIPFTLQFEIFIYNQVFSLISLINGKRKKAIFLDLDDTLWGGTLAETSYKKLNIGGIEPKGEAFKKLQTIIKNFKNSGIILCIVSRNDEKKALEAIRKHPEMVLGLEDFAGWRINHNNKSSNILSLCEELNIKPDSVVFLDNSKYERAEVKAKIPEILVPELDDEPYNYFNILAGIKELSYYTLSKEDLNRSSDYINLRKSNLEKTKYSSHEDWLKSLKMKLTIENFKKVNLDRIHQMYNKINQLNSTSRRLDRSTILKENKKKNNFLITARLTDNLIDFGIIGLLKFTVKNKIVVVEDFLFSCRALGRGLEKYFIEITLNDYLKKNYQIKFKFNKSDKNKLCEDLLKSIFNKKNKRNEIIFNNLIKKTYKSKIVSIVYH